MAALHRDVSRVGQQRCGVENAGEKCGADVAVESQLNLCTSHLLAAYDWVSRDVGITDVLPAPCLACGSRLGVRYPSGWLCAICEWKVGDLPDSVLSTVRVDVVYYIRAGDRIKIGTSGHPRGRLTQLRFDELLAFERGTRVVEQKRHGQFADHRLGRSEWFSVHPALSDHIDVLRVTDEDPWDRYRFWVSQEIALHS